MGAITLLLLAIGLSIPAGLYLAWLDGAPSDRVERATYRLVGLPAAPPGMDWKRYSVALVGTNVVMGLVVFAIFVWQGGLPLNPQGFAGMKPIQAFCMAVSFITNTNWQSYLGENALSHLSQTAAITFAMFTSAATGLAAAWAFIRGLVGRPNLGNFYADLIRLTWRLLLPVSAATALVLVWQGVPQTFEGSVVVTGPQGTEQAIPRGPVASLVSIKQLGTNGGGYFGQNSAHPLENPTPLSNGVELLLMFCVTLAPVVAIGRMLGNLRQSLVMYGALLPIFLTFFGLVWTVETAGNPLLAGIAGGNLEGKEVRFGIPETALFVATTTAGAVNCMHDSLLPLGGFVPLSSILLGNAFGSIGLGFMKFMLFGIVGAFLTGLMVGRTPEFFGKKLERREIGLAAVALFIGPLIVLLPTAIAAINPFGVASLSNSAYHGLSEILYAYASTGGNNGSAFAGLNADTPWYNLSTGITMLIGRYPPMVLMFALAGSLGGKLRVPEGPGTLRTDTLLFGMVWLAVNVVVGAMVFFPALALGPIAEQVALGAGRLFP